MFRVWKGLWWLCSLFTGRILRARDLLYLLVNCHKCRYLLLVLRYGNHTTTFLILSLVLQGRLIPVHLFSLNDVRRAQLLIDSGLTFSHRIDTCATQNTNQHFILIQLEAVLYLNHLLVSKLVHHAFSVSCAAWKSIKLSIIILVLWSLWPSSILWLLLLSLAWFWWSFPYHVASQLSSFPGWISAEVLQAPLTQLILLLLHHLVILRGAQGYLLTLKGHFLEWFDDDELLITVVLLTPVLTVAVHSWTLLSRWVLDDDVDTVRHDVVVLAPLLPTLLNFLHFAF